MRDWAKEIEDDLSWREGELGILKLIASGASHDSSKYSSLLRALWALLYAHYEGFCKFMWVLYLGEIEKENLPRESLEHGLCIFSLQKEFKVFRTSNDTDLFQRILSNKILKTRVSFPDRFEEESNLWPNVLIENCSKIGISCEEAKNNKKFLSTLVARRNDIAHGKKMQIKDLVEYQTYEDIAFLVMHEIAVSVAHNLENKSYLKRV